MFDYSSYGFCTVEAEVDVLTGEIQLLQSDILFDCGQRRVRLLFPPAPRTILPSLPSTRAVHSRDSSPWFLSWR